MPIFVMKNCNNFIEMLRFFHINFYSSQCNEKIKNEQTGNFYRLHRWARRLDFHVSIKNAHTYSVCVAYQR